jgi:hypothetical protein
MTGPVARGGMGGLVRLRYARALLLKSNFVRTFPVTLNSARGVTSAGAETVFRTGAAHWPHEAI